MMLTMYLKRMATVVAAMSALASVVACSDDDPATPAQANEAVYPRSVNIEYKVTSSSGLTTADIIYWNDTGGQDSKSAVALPFSLTFQRSVDKFDSVAVSPTSNVGGSLTAEILVDGNSVKKETYSGDKVATGTTVYVFQ